MENHLKKLQLKVHGTHCASCEVLIERKWKKIQGVEKVHVNFASGKAELLLQDSIKLHELADVIKSDGYSVSLWENRHKSPEGDMHKNTFDDYMQIGATLMIILNAYLILQQLRLIPEGLSVSDNMSYGFILLIGVVASVSTCLAMTGGLLLTVNTEYSKIYPNLSGYKKFKPTLYFNVGRVASYTILGGLVGWLGSAISLSPWGTGILTIIASLVMIVLGFQMLNLFPWMRRLQPKMPKFIAHKIHDLSGQEGRVGAFTLGALTFFLPCGFTQALQLYVLAKGSFVVGALTMFAFSLGTLPVLLSLGVVSSFTKGAVQKHFLRFSAILIILLGFWNINNGLALAGINIDLSLFAPKNLKANIGTAQIIDGKQVVEMRVDGYEYYPSQFTVARGIPVEWRIDAKNAAGCAKVIIARSIDVAKYLSPSSVTVINFTPTETGIIPFSCSMGMTTRGASFRVI
ncbi:MAG: sulfite exporter TauE/SafE family protein [bacterium]|nr:sulfite exporter TauE/SafE family protein [bacterium]